MLSNQDVKRLLGVFATKQDLENLVTQDNFDAKTRDIMGKLESIYGEIKDSRLENDAHLIRHADSEKLLKRITSIPVIAHELKK